MTLQLSLLSKRPNFHFHTLCPFMPHTRTILLENRAATQNLPSQLPASYHAKALGTLVGEIECATRPNQTIYMKHTSDLRTMYLFHR